MATRKTLASYSDCLKILDLALSNRGGKIDFGERRKATVFRQRCYKVRAILHEQAKENLSANMLSSTPYDDILITHDVEGILLFRLRSEIPIPPFEPLPKDEQPAPAEDDFLAQAEALAKSLK